MASFCTLHAPSPAALNFTGHFCPHVLNCNPEFAAQIEWSSHCPMVELNGRLARWGLPSLGCSGAIAAHRARRFVFMVGWTMPCHFPLLHHTLQIYVKEV